MTEKQKVIEIPVEPRDGKAVTFRIGGKDYDFRMPKVYGLLRTIRGLRSGASDDPTQELALLDQVESWLFDCLAPDDASELQARLLDEHDDLDVQHLTAVFQKMVEIASDRPSG